MLEEDEDEDEDEEEERILIKDFRRNARLAVAWRREVSWRRSSTNKSVLIPYLVGNGHDPLCQLLLRPVDRHGLDNTGIRKPPALHLCPNLHDHVSPI